MFLGKVEVRYVGPFHVPLVLLLYTSPKPFLNANPTELRVGVSYAMMARRSIGGQGQGYRQRLDLLVHMTSQPTITSSLEVTSLPGSSQIKLALDLA